MERKEIINQLIKDGAKSVKDLVVKNVTVTPQEKYVRVGLTLDKEVDGYVVKTDKSGNQEYVLDKTNLIFVSAFSIAAILRDNEDASFAANHCLNYPDTLCLVLNRAKINIVQESVAAETEYRNPFLSEDSDYSKFDHDVIINHLANIEISDFGLKRLDKLADKMMGF